MGAFEAAVSEVKVEVQKRIAETARAEHAKVMTATPIPQSFTRYVDGVKGAPESAVRGDGVIVYDYARMNLVVEWIVTALQQLSPVDSGDYVRSHTIFLNDNPVADVKAWKRGDRLAISNTVPYARKIEAGQKGFRRHPRVYERAAQRAQRQFSGFARIRFGYMALDEGDVGAWAAGTSLTGKGRGPRSKTLAEWLRRQPAIFIFMD